MRLKAKVIGVIMLAMTGLVDSQAGSFLKFDLAAQDLITSLTLTEGQANELMDRLCGQRQGAGAVSGSAPVSGAINIRTGVFMTWAEYLAGPGQVGNPAYYHAVDEWETFWGTCSLAAESTWFQNGPTSIGNVALNVRWDNALAVERMVPLNIYLPAFHCRTTLPSLFPRIASHLDCAVEFGGLTGLPEWVTTPLRWWGFNRMQDAYLSPDPQPHMVIPPCQLAVCTATTSLRVVRAVLVFHVRQYSWNNARSSANVDSWRDWGRGDQVHWDFIYSSGGYIDGLGLTLMRPGDGGYTNVQCNHNPLADVDQCY
jgi:hypothetical protein